MFALEVEFLSGRVYATDFRERDVSEWPPHPSRLFSALVAAFYESGLDSDLRTSLVWLEEQKSPDIWAGSFVTRLESAAGSRFNQPKTPRSFVPINDDYSGKFRNSARRRKERWFPSGTPEDERVHFIWGDAAPNPATVDALRRIAAQVSYLGHSSSLVRVAVIESPRNAVLKPSDSGDILPRVPSKGRLEYLDREFTRSKGTRQFRPDAGAVQRYARVGGNEVSTPTPASSFGEMIVFQRLNGSPERIESLLMVTSVLRDALMARSPQQPAPGCISGHDDTPHISEIVRALMEKVRGRSKAPEFNWADDLSVPPQEFSAFAKTAFQAATSKKRESVDFCAAFGSEGALTGKHNIDPTALCMSSGQQCFLKKVRELCDLTEKPALSKKRNVTLGRTIEVRFHDVLSGPLNYSDSQHSLGWDPINEALHALGAYDPSGKGKQTSVRELVYLALEAVSLFPVFARSRRLQTTGFHTDERRQTWFHWPVWEPELSLRTVQSLLQLGELASPLKNEVQLRARGIRAIYRSRRHTFGQDYGIFRPAQLVAAG